MIKINELVSTFNVFLENKKHGYVCNQQEMGDEKAIALIKRISSYGNITVLLLDDNNLTDAVIPTIIECLILNEKLSMQRINLQSNQITEAGALALIAALEQRNTLRKLALRGNPEVTMASIEKLEAMTVINQPPRNVPGM
jgi:hypothetical protein